MGNQKSLNVQCEVCQNKYGINPIIYVSDSSDLNGHTICLNCYESEKFNLKKNINFKSLQCEWCKYKSKVKDNKIPVFKIYWKGKFGNHIMCKKCVYDKIYRRKNINL